MTINSSVSNWVDFLYPVIFFLHAIRKHSIVEAMDNPSLNQEGAMNFDKIIMYENEFTYSSEDK